MRRIGGKGRRREIARFCSSDSRKWPDYASTDDETNLQTLSLRQANRHREARNDYTTQRSDFLYADYLIATCFFFLCKRLLSAASVKEYDGCVITTIIEISSVNTQRNYGKNTFNLDVLLYLHRYKYHWNLLLQIFYQSWEIYVPNFGNFWWYNYFWIAKHVFVLYSYNHNWHFRCRYSTDHERHTRCTSFRSCKEACSRAGVFSPIFNRQ